MKCDTCGSPVKIVGDTTKHYEPLMTQEDIDECAATIEKYDRKLSKIEQELLTNKNQILFLLNEFHSILNKNPNAVGLEEAADMAVEFHMIAHKAIYSYRQTK